MPYHEAITDTTAYGASPAELERWKQTGGCSDEDLRREPILAAPNPNHIPPHLNRFDALLLVHDISKLIVASQVSEERL